MATILDSTVLGTVCLTFVLCCKASVAFLRHFILSEWKGHTSVYISSIGLVSLENSNTNPLNGTLIPQISCMSFCALHVHMCFTHRANKIPIPGINFNFALMCTILPTKRIHALELRYVIP